MRRSVIASTFAAMLFSLSANATPVVLNSAIDNGQVTINGTGFVSPITVQLNGKKLTVVSSTASQITAKLGAPLAQGTYRLVVVAGTAQTVTTVTASGIISGFVNADCSIQTGTGFTCVVNNGTYTLTFPTGAFNGPTPPVAVVTPFYSGGNAMNFGVYSTTYPGDGSATITFNFSPLGVGAGNPVPFTFIAVNGH
jgi:IPT/TIG domain-containing protein